MNAILEIGCEEIPARFMPSLLEDLKSKAEEKLKKERIPYEKVETFGSSRRLVLWLENLSPKQANLEEEVKGPPAEAAFDVYGKPTPAALGFAKSQGVSTDKLTIRTLGNKNYVFAKVIRKGKPVEKVLQNFFPEIISSLYLPIAMRWGSLEFKFIRPIHWLMAICNGKTLKFTLAGINSSNKTYGHRYLTKKRKTIIFNRKKQTLLHYKKELSKLGVLVDQNERKEIIRKEVEAAASRQGLKALIEEDLLNEVTFLVENPKVFVGNFDKNFLQLPQEVLITSMKKNQKYFPFLDREGKLSAKFAVVTDGCKNKKVIEGNEKVISARLSDARFFFEEDQKQPLKIRVADLEKVAFFEKLGTLYHKTERICKMAEWLGKRLKLSEEEIKTTRRVAELCKADLTTKMVFEFPELQGIMGREYALLSGENPKVALGIFEHYLPRFADDKLPATVEGVTVALADRLDSIVGAFSAGYVPTGSEDPYGIRRATHGIIRIILEKKIDLLLDEAIEYAYRLYEPVFLGYLFQKGETNYKEFPRIKKEILDFIAGRLKPLLLEKGVRHDIVDAVLSDFNDILDVVEKALTLSSLVNESWFPEVVISADRVSRLAKDAPREQVLEHDLMEKEEKELYDLYLKVNWEVNEWIKKENWSEATKALTKLTCPINVFFEKVLVMHENERLKINRLALLKSLANLYLAVADFRKIVIEGEKK